MGDSTTRTKKSSRKRGLARITVKRSESDELSSSYSSARSASYSSARSSSYSSARSSKRSVSFADTRRIRPIPALSDMSKKDVNNLYYSEAECDKMKEACVRVIRKIVSRNAKYDIDSIESEWRGLEKKTREGSDKRKANRESALLAVLNEQKKQRKHPSIANVETIRQKYRRITEECRQIALRMAAYDAAVVQQRGASSKVRALKPSDFLPPMPAKSKKSAIEKKDPVVESKTPASPEPSPMPTMAWNMVSPHDETLSHDRLVAMMNASNNMLGGSQRQLSLAV